ncbi:AraC family transcriptional regulator [Pseudochelatococcus sp. B33]
MDKRIRQALIMLDQSIAEERDVDDIAGRLSLTLHHFHRLFVAEVGETPAGYLRRIRLDAAALRLRWTNDPVSVIAQNVGYGSQAALTRAFAARFETTPGKYRMHFHRRGKRRYHPQLSSIFTRKIDSYTLLSRRYHGSVYRVREFWTDFGQRLPEAILTRIDIPYIGLFYDDPHVTVPEQTRYDCCVVIPSLSLISKRELADRGLFVIHSRAGLYAGLSYVGHRNGLEDSFRLLTENWLANSAYTATEDPIIELHVNRRDLQPIDRLEITLLCPIE